jgi:hypothetical protein
MIMKNLLILFITLISLSCSAQTIVISNTTDLSEQESEIGQYFNQFAIFQNIQNKGNFEYMVDSDSNDGYVYGNGLNLDGSDVVFRVKTDNSNGIVKLTDQAGVISAESCSGVNCSKCAFASGGGCSCETIGSVVGGASYCNHSKSR